MQVDEITLRAVNTKRRNMGKPPLSRREANHAARNYSALDISSLLTTYTPYFMVGLVVVGISISGLINRATSPVPRRRANRANRLLE
jgi:hypothetical protein